MKIIKGKSIPQRKIKNIQLKNVGDKVSDVREFREQLISNLGDEIFYYQTKQILLFNILKQISPINKSLKLNDESIEIACKKVISHFGLNKKVKVTALTKNGSKEVTFSEKTNTQKFCKMIIEMDKVPFDAYQKISSEVNNDLMEISDLIKWYESDSYIQRYIKDNAMPRNHEEGIRLDFYKRCLKERAKIFNYQLYGLKKRAIEKSKYIPEWIGGLYSFIEKQKDRPYYFATVFGSYYFDCRKIDLVGHRITDLSVSEGIKMYELYKNNPYKFYKLYFKRIPIQQHFHNFKFHLAHLPLKKDRSLIFDELIKLFKAKRWISFYALALPQVEGLFAEMAEIVSEKNLKTKALPDKVNSVRPYYHFSEDYFDYYQYYIPLQRNRFSHTGYDEDFKIKSFDLLVDLSHILQVFSELDSPLVKVKKILKRRSIQDFVSIKEITGYLTLLDNLKPQQKNDIDAEIKSFEKDFLSNECNLEYTCYQLVKDLPVLLMDFIDFINTYLSKKYPKTEFEKLTKPEIDSFCNNEKQLELLTDCFMFKSDSFETLEVYFSFIHKYKKHLPSLKQEAKNELIELHKNYGETLKKIIHAGNKIKQEIEKNKN